MRILAVDLETFSDQDIKTVGAYRYVDSPEFGILLFAYAFDDDPVQVIDLAGEFEAIPDEVVVALTDPAVTKTAHNANFERGCLAKHLGVPMDPAQWSCTQVMALYNGLPAALGMVAKALHMEQEKDTAGKALIKYFCCPVKPTKVNKGRTRNHPHHDPIKWAAFVEYCRQDVVVERDIRKRLRPLPAHEQRLWCLDQLSNDKGIRLDMVLADNAVALFDDYVERLKTEAIGITGLANPNSLQQLKGWMETETGEAIDSLDKAGVAGLLRGDHSEDAMRMLDIRRELGKSSVKKYHLMQKAVCADGNIRGVLQFYGGNRTLRDAGRLLQVQNLVKNSMSQLDLARRMLRDGYLEGFEMLFGNVPDTLSQLIRTALIPEEGQKWLVGDFSAIEARVIAWLADEEWRLEVFRTHGKIYEKSAAMMFGIPMEEVTKGSKWRQMGKVAELGCGFGGGYRALETMSPDWAATQTEEALRDIITRWRAASPSIVRLWADAELAMKEAIRYQTKVPLRHGVYFEYRAGNVYAGFPSGKETCYVEARLEPREKFGRVQECITFWGVEEGRWCKQETYGGKAVENIVQSFARDCLMVAFSRLMTAGFDVRFRVHDELVVTGNPERHGEMLAIMGKPISWAPGLPLPAEGDVLDYYMKAD